MKGGRRPNAGRKKGSKTKFNRALSEAGASLERIKATGELPLDFLVRIQRDEAQDIDVRVDAAKAAAPYLHRKQPQDVNNNVTLNIPEKVVMDVVGLNRDGK